MTRRKLIQHMRELGRRSAAKRAKENFDYSTLGKKAWEGKTKKEIDTHMKMMREAWRRKRDND